VRIVNRALTREVLASAFGALAVFVSLFFVVTLIKVLGRAVAGEISLNVVFTLLGLQTIKTLGIILPLALYVGIILALGRWYRDSEMAVLSACGVGLGQLLRPVLRVALGFAAAAALFAFYLEPLAVTLIAKTRAEEQGQFEAKAVTPGVFSEMKRGASGVYFVEQVGPLEGQLGGVFLSHEHLGRAGVLLAQEGEQYVDAVTGDSFLLLKHGRRYEGVPGQGDYRMVEFERYGVRIEPQQAVNYSAGFDAMGVAELYERRQAEPRALAQLHWRAAKPIAVFVLTLFAMVFAYTNPRQGRFLGLFVAIMVYFIYSNAIGVGNVLLIQGKARAAAGLWWVHAVFLVLALILLRRRIWHRPLLPMPRWPWSAA